MSLRKISLFLLVKLAFSYTSQENTTQPENWKSNNPIPNRNFAMLVIKQ